MTKKLIQFVMGAILLSTACIPFNREWAEAHNASWISVHRFSQGVVWVLHGRSDP